MEVDVLLKTADNNGNIVKARYCESSIGVNKGMASSQRFYAYLGGHANSLGKFSFQEYASSRFCKLRKAKDLQEVGLIHSSVEVYESIWSEGISI